MCVVHKSTYIGKVFNLKNFKLRIFQAHANNSASEIIKKINVNRSSVALSIKDSYNKGKYGKNPYSPLCIIACLCAFPHFRHFLLFLLSFFALEFVNIFDLCQLCRISAPHVLFRLPKRVLIHANCICYVQMRS